MQNNTHQIVFCGFGKLILGLLLFLVALPMAAQKRNINLTINVTTNTGESLKGQTVDLQQTDYSLGYGTLTLDDKGSVSVKVYAGNHKLTITRSGYNDFTSSFSVSKDTTVTAQLVEAFQTPYSLSTNVEHNAQTGLNDVTLTWNREAPVFFDDFESYEPFATTFGSWTGIDRDHLTAAPLVGSYPNRGVFEYAQIISPMNVDPTWWYDYPILRPYGGLQYVGFIRTGSNEPNDDWLISPTITPGNDNVLQFMAHAADQYDEKFQVYVTTKTDNPDVSDFTMISSGNYESVDYKSWHRMTYDLSQYAGTPIKFAIRYLGNYNNFGAFMLMVDNVYVGQRPLTASQVKASPIAPVAKRVTKNSPLNPNESFRVYLNDAQVGTTEDYSYTYKGLTAGTYKLGVQSVYKASQSAIVDTTITISGRYARVNAQVLTNNNKSVDGNVLVLTAKSSAETFTDTIKNGTATFASLPYGNYLAEVSAPNYEDFTTEFTINKDTTVSIPLTEKIIDPYNLTADVTYDADNQDYDAVVKWNQNLSFYDSFESYPDFATGSFGDWRTYDLDQHICYPISLNGTVINFPGASTTDKPSAVPPLVFNPKSTTPAMTSDAAVLAPQGDKTIIFFSPQQNGANKWLVSPLITVRDSFVVRFAAKSYTDMYGNDQMEVAVSTSGNDPQTSNFTTVSTINPVTAGQWTLYETDLKNYVGQQVYIGVHYVSYDCFFSQLDNFYVGNPSGSSFVDVGAVGHYNIYLDGKLVGTSTTPTFTINSITAGTHTVGIEAVYTSGKSKIVTTTINTATGIEAVCTNKTDVSAPAYNLAGQRVSSTYRGIVIQNGHKFIRK